MNTLNPLSRRRRTGFWLVCVMISLLLAMFGVSVIQASVPIEVGFKDFSYPKDTGGNSEPTGEKPESKLWWNDGFWWGILWSTGGNAYHIHRLELGNQDWVDTGTAVDRRKNTRSDALWDGQRLYVASHVFSTNGQPAPAGQRGELYRYSYNSTAKTYSLDAGFPVEVNGSNSETLVIDKDGLGTLWVTYTEGQKVMVNRSLNKNDLTWGTPFVLPISEATNLATDDISAVVSYANGTHVGVMWSNQTTKKMYFAVHPANAPDNVWTRVIPYSVSADDHINLKSLEIDNAGNIYSVIKTSRSSALIVMLVCKKNINACKSDSDWTSHTVYSGKIESPTRPVLLIDASHRDLYVFTRNKASDGSSGIYYKLSDLDNIQFPDGIGVPFIKSATDTGINDPTSTKQTLNTTTGLVVLASDSGAKYYFHNYMSLGGGASPPVANFSGTPTSGTAPLTVNFSDLSTGSPTSWSWDFGDGGTSTQRNPSYTYNSAGSYTVTLIASNASGSDPETKTGYITVSNPSSTQFSLAVSVVGSGGVTANPPGGVYDSGTVVTLTATPGSGYVFSGWSGDLSGNTNPATITMNANKTVTATFVQQGSSGSVSYAETQTGGSSSSNIVATTNSLTGVSGNLYLAAISTRPRVAVNSISGLGLSWTRVDLQCAGRNQTGVELWMALGAPSGNGTVAASLAGTPYNAVIAVSRYAGVNPSSPIGSVISGNTNGLDGACSGGTDNRAYAFNLTTTASGSVVYSTAAMRNSSHTPGAGFTERVEARQGSSGATASIAVQDKAVPSGSSTTVDGSFSNLVDWAIIGVEIKPGG